LSEAREPGEEGVIGPQRLEAFSDGVIAIILTVMVLELKVPHGVTTASLEELAPQLASYVLSFVVVASMWVNHHHAIRIVERVDGVFLWKNIHLLFWMSLVPFTTAYVGENYAAPLPVALYGGNVCAFSLSFLFLLQGVRSRARPGLAGASGRGVVKSWIAIAFYAASVPLAWVSVWSSIAIFVVIPLMFFLPEKSYGVGGKR
jgi:uncharacterized membrane protein